MNARIKRPWASACWRFSWLYWCRKTCIMGGTISWSEIWDYIKRRWLNPKHSLLPVSWLWIQNARLLQAYVTLMSPPWTVCPLRVFYYINRKRDSNKAPTWRRWMCPIRDLYCNGPGILINKQTRNQKQTVCFIVQKTNHKQALDKGGSPGGQ